MARILVVDDSDDMRRLFLDIFSRDQHEVVEAVNGIAGFACLMADQFDAVVLDVMMPDLDGLTLCRLLRNVPALMGLPVVIVSGASTEAAAIAAGADAFLHKPFRPSRLLGAINDLMANGRTRRPEEAMRVVVTDVAEPDEARADVVHTIVAPTAPTRSRGAVAYRRANGQANGKASSRAATPTTRRVKAASDQPARDSA